MILIVIGMNYKTAPINIRERWSFNKESTKSLLKQLIAQKLMESGVLVSTCNRTELYCSATKVSTLINWLKASVNLTKEELHKYFYIYTGVSTIKHLMKVASGLDSMLLGETEILGQLKSSFKLANELNLVEKELHRLFQVAFSVAKRVRTETEIGVNPISIANIAVNLTNQLFDNISEKNFLLVGAGDMIKLVKEHLIADGIKNITIANRTLEHARLLSINSNIKICSLHDMPHILKNIDVIISCTACNEFVIKYDDIANAIVKRKYSPMMIVDMGVPRDVEPQVRHLDDVFLYCIDDLQIVMEENKNMRQQAALEAEKIINKEAIGFFNWIQEQSVVPIIKEFKENAEVIRDEIVSTALQKIRSGNSPEMVLQWLAHVLTNRLTHGPIVSLKKITIEESITDDIIALLKQLQ